MSDSSVLLMSVNVRPIILGQPKTPAYLVSGGLCGFGPATEHRDAFDLVLVAGITPVSRVAYLVVLGLLFIADAVWYVLSRASAIRSTLKRLKPQLSPSRPLSLSSQDQGVTTRINLMSRYPIPLRGSHKFRREKPTNHQPSNSI